MNPEIDADFRAVPTFPQDLRTVSTAAHFECSRRRRANSAKRSERFRSWRERWLLLWGAYIVEQYEPKEGQSG
jgi:hypothetical protein